MGDEVIPAVLGWANPDPAVDNVRLYALDRGGSPRWAPDGGRSVERAIVERDGGNREGDRYLVVRVGTRFSEERMRQLQAQIEGWLRDG